jgi:hypothetical protein
MDETKNELIRREFDLAVEYFGGGSTTLEDLLKITAERCGTSPARVEKVLSAEQKKRFAKRAPPK